jgi:hypothetical protein
MPELPSHKTGAPSPYVLKSLWSVPGSALVRGMSVVREGNYLFVWDENNCLQLFNARGTLQSRARIPGQVVAAAAADSGNCYVAVTGDGRLFSLGPDLGVRRCRQFRTGILALALDPHGHYLLFADAGSGLGMSDIDGCLRWFDRTPCPFVYLAFMPVLPFAVGCSTLGLSACYSFEGHLVWQRGLVCHIGALVIRGADGLCGLACYSEGLQQYSFAGKSLGRWRLREPCRLVSVAFASELFLVAGLSNRVCLVNQAGGLLAETGLEKPAGHIALSAAGDQGFAALYGGGLVSFQIERGRDP